jgi:hypothetical protein
MAQKMFNSAVRETSFWKIAAGRSESDANYIEVKEQVL